MILHSQTKKKMKAYMKQISLSMISFIKSSDYNLSPTVQQAKFCYLSTFNFILNSYNFISISNYFVIRKLENCVHSYVMFPPNPTKVFFILIFKCKQNSMKFYGGFFCFQNFTIAVTTSAGKWLLSWKRNKISNNL